MKKTFKLLDLDCAHCAQKMEDGIRKLDGVQKVTVNFLSQKLTLEADALTRSPPRPPSCAKRSSPTASWCCKPPPAPPGAGHDFARLQPEKEEHFP